MAQLSEVNRAAFSPFEELLHALSHGLGALLSIAGLVVLVVLASLHDQADPWKIVSLSIYGTTLCLLYSSSTLYHATKNPKLKRLFRTFDHCTIYLLIAGTYTPFLLVNLRDTVGWTLFCFVWGLAIIGITLRIIWPHRFSLLRVIVYLIMGWIIVTASGDIAKALPTAALYWLIAGGVIYTLGVIFYAIRAIPYHHAIWHLFVLGGSIAHFIAIYYAVVKT